MSGNEIINKLTGAPAYDGYRWTGVNIGTKNLASNNLVYTEDLVCAKSNWDYGITLNEDVIKEVVEKIAKKRELAKITPDDGPEIPKWVGFLEI